MTKKKYSRYSADFKRHALQRASEDGVSPDLMVAN